MVKLPQDYTDKINNQNNISLPYFISTVLGV